MLEFSTVGSGHSTHITLSAYASNSWMDYFNTTIEHIQGNEKDEVALRSGLPLNFHKLVSYYDYCSVLRCASIQRNDFKFCCVKVVAVFCFFNESKGLMIIVLSPDLCIARYDFF